MPDKLEILTFFADKEKERLAVSHKILMRELELTADAAFKWTSRLRKQGLIKFKFISNLGNYCYGLTRRGKERLLYLKTKNTEPAKSKNPVTAFLDQVEDFLFEE